MEYTPAESRLVYCPVTMSAPYSTSFYDEMEDSNLASARAVVPLVLSLVPARSVVDIGCGEGLWLKAFSEAGVSDIEGYDGAYVVRENLKIPQEKFNAANLEEPITLSRIFDLAVCLEVAEHVSDEHSRQLIESLTNAAPVILFSAAIPGQGGVNHVNEQWPKYWQERFKEEGYVPVDCIRHQILDKNEVAFYYAQNILVYVKEELLARYPRLQEEIESGHGGAPAFVHPQLYTYYESRWNKIAPLLWKVPQPLIKLGNKLLKRKH